MHKSARSRFVLTLFVVLMSGAMAGFDYPEHQFFTARAFTTLTRLCQQGDDNASDALAQLTDVPLKSFCEHLDQAISAGFSAIESGHTCRQLAPARPDFCTSMPSQCAWSPAPNSFRFALWSGKECFNLSDLPALAGDHSGSPVLLRWRWFDDCLADRCQEPILWTLFWRVAMDPGTLDTGPETALSRKPNRELLLKELAPLAWPNWPNKAPDLLALQAADDAFVSLKGRSAHHFRPPFVGASPGVLSERGEYLDQDDRSFNKPARHALAVYGDLHAGARRFARAARNENDDKLRRQLLGVAMLLELNSAHYLQDGVAPGHFIPDARVLTATSIARTHDHYNLDGVLVPLPRGLRVICDMEDTIHEALGVADLCRESRRRTDRYVRIVGDSRIEEQCRSTDSDKPDCATSAFSDDADPNNLGWRATSDWSSLLTMWSIVEVVEVLAVRGTLPPDLNRNPPSDCLRNPLLRRKPYMPSGPRSEDRALCDPEGVGTATYACLAAWWQSSGPVRERVAEVQMELGSARAVYALPVPDGTSRSLPEIVDGAGGDFSGPGLQLALGPTFTRMSRNDDLELAMTFRIGRPWLQNIVGGPPNQIAFWLPLVQVTHRPGSSSTWLLHAVHGFRWDLFDRRASLGFELAYGYNFASTQGSFGFQPLVAFNLLNSTSSLVSLVVTGSLRSEDPGLWGVSMGLEVMFDNYSGRGP